MFNVSTHFVSIFAIPLLLAAVLCEASYVVIGNYKITDDVSTYLKYSTGYNGGGFNARASTLTSFTTPFAEEEVESWELGLLRALFDALAYRVTVLVHDTIPLDHPEFSRADAPAAFAAKLAALGFKLDPKTREPMLAARDLLLDVPQSRLFDEMLKLLQTGHALASIEQLKSTGLNTGIYPLLDVVVERGDDPFVKLALQDTDRRVGEGKPVAPSFLLACVLWADVRRGWEQRLQSRPGHKPVPAFAALHFQGHTLTLGDWVNALQATCGPLRIQPLPWPLLRVLSLLSPTLRSLCGMRYLWQRPHQLDNASLKGLIGTEPHTPWPDALHQALRDLGHEPRLQNAHA